LHAIPPNSKCELFSNYHSKIILTTFDKAIKPVRLRLNRTLKFKGPPKLLDTETKRLNKNKLEIINI